MHIDQQWLANEIGISQSKLSDIENGKITDFKVFELVNLQKNLKLPISSLIEGNSVVNLFSHDYVFNSSTLVKNDVSLASIQSHLETILDVAKSTGEHNWGGNIAIIQGGLEKICGILNNKKN